jgi:hypothetical protein
VADLVAAVAGGGGLLLPFFGRQRAVASNVPDALATEKESERRERERERETELWEAVGTTIVAARSVQERLKQQVQIGHGAGRGRK